MNQDHARIPRTWPALLFAVVLLLGNASLRAQFGGGVFVAGDEIEAFGGGGFLAPSSRFEPLVETITGTIEPDSWDDMGGPGSIRSVEHWGVVVVRQTDEVHEQIQHLLAALREARQAEEAGDGMTPMPDPEADANSLVLVVESKANSSARKRIEAALSSPAEFSFIETPLADVVGHIMEKHGIEMQLDVPSLDGVGIGSDTPITREISGISLRSALRLILRDLELCYIVRDEVLTITTAEIAEKSMTTRIYRAADLALPAK